MALIECSECGNQVSDRAASCPKCGNPVAELGAAADTIRRGTNRAKMRYELAYLLMACAAILGFIVGVSGQPILGLVIAVGGGVGALVYGYS